MFKAATPFVASETLRRRDNDGSASFAARHFAIRRAGFLLREHAKQMATPAQFADDLAIITPADDLPELLIEPIDASSTEDLSCAHMPRKRYLQSRQQQPVALLRRPQSRQSQRLIPAL